MPQTIKYGCCLRRHWSPELIAHNSRVILSFVTEVLSKMAETRKPNKLFGTHPKGYGKGSRACRVTGRLGGHGLVRKYGINMKRQVFRERAIDMGWVKYN
jgi:small subunit ribosomal protein S29e